MTPAGRLGTGALFAAALGAQVLLQGPLERANAVRATRKLHTAPSSLAFRLAAAGVQEAAADALWLSVLPKLGRTWVDPERKAAWIESVTGVMTDANPRAVNPVIYAAYFLELGRKRHPAIERVVRRAMDAEVATPFAPRRRVNAEDHRLPEVLGMNLTMYGSAEEKARGLGLLEEAARKPGAPTILIDLVAAIRAKAGSPLAGWDLWLLRAADLSDPGLRRALHAVAGSDPGADPEGEPSHPEWRDQFLREADGARREVLRKWAGAAEQRLGRWPSSLEEVLAEAPPAERESWERNPARRAALAEGVEVLPATRDVVIGTLAEWQDAQTREFLRLLCRHHELTTGRKPASLRDLDAFPHRPVPPPARHGTRWELDPATGEPEVVNDMADPRLRAPSGPSLLGR